MSGTNHAPEAAAVASPKSKLLLFVAFAFAAFAMSYNYAVAQSSDGGGTDGGGLFAQSAGGGCGMSGGSGGGGCCGGGGGPAVEGATTLEGDSQFIAVDTSTGNFAPNVIKAQAGVPIVIEFSQAPGGCLAGVYIPQFGVNEDLTGGAKRIELPALEAGTYDFYCQMQMISAQIVVE